MKLFPWCALTRDSLRYFVIDCSYKKHIKMQNYQILRVSISSHLIIINLKVKILNTKINEKVS